MLPSMGQPEFYPILPAEPQIGDLPNDKEQLGEYLYPLVEVKTPQYASKVTGMLLEMETKQIHNIIRDPNQLDKWINEALRVLSKSEQVQS